MFSVNWPKQMTYKQLTFVSPSFRDDRNESLIAASITASSYWPCFVFGLSTNCVCIDSSAKIGSLEACELKVKKLCKLKEILTRI